MCGEEEEIETIEHTLCSCPWLQVHIMNLLGNHFLRHLGNIFETVQNRETLGTDCCTAFILCSSQVTHMKPNALKRTKELGQGSRNAYNLKGYKCITPKIYYPVMDNYNEWYATEEMTSSTEHWQNSYQIFKDDEVRRKVFCQHSSIMCCFPEDILWSFIQIITSWSSNLNDHLPDYCRCRRNPVKIITRTVIHCQILQYLKISQISVLWKKSIVAFLYAST